MELNLVGQTVTQAVAMLREAVAQAQGESIVVKTDNETVKLNLYNQFHRLGLRCKAERKGPFHYLHLKSTKRMETEEDKPAPGVQTSTKEKSAFPIGHLGGEEKTPAPLPSPNKPKRRRLVEPVADKAAQPAPPQPLGPPQDKLCWLVIQHDQIGNRDTGLGVELMEDLLNGLDSRRFAGVFLVHRGVRLLDPLYADGRLLRTLVRKNLKLTACERSTAFYQLTDRISVPTAPFSEVMNLAAIYELVWV